MRNGLSGRGLIHAGAARAARRRAVPAMLLAFALSLTPTAAHAQTAASPGAAAPTAAMANDADAAPGARVRLIVARAANNVRALPVDMRLLTRTSRDIGGASAAADFSLKFQGLTFDLISTSAFVGHDPMANADLVVSVHHRF